MGDGLLDLERKYKRLWTCLSHPPQHLGSGLFVSPVVNKGRRGWTSYLEISGAGAKEVVPLQTPAARRS